jgi:branched-chain amino acid transport system ATP-binding protein
MTSSCARPRGPTGLVATGVSKRFGGVNALDDVGLCCGQHEIVGLIGPNGAGKTTLLDVISAVQRPDAGTVALDDEEVQRLPPHKVAQRGMARTFQSVRLFQRLTVRQHIEVGACAARMAPVARAGMEQDEILDELGLARLADRRPPSLPYALQRRLEIARAVASKPKFLLLDEPAAGTSELESSELAVIVRRVHERAGCGVVLVDHDLPFVMGLCHRIYVLDEGRPLAEGSPAEVQRDPSVIDVYLGRREPTDPATTTGERRPT